MNRNVRLSLVLGTLAVGLFVPGMISGKEDPGIDLITSVVAVESVHQTNRGLLGKEPITLEELKQIDRPRNVCNVMCSGYPIHYCTEVCGEGAGCFDGYCLYW